MRGPRGVILLAIMLVLGVLTIAAVPLIGARSSWTSSSSPPTIRAPHRAQLAACRRAAVARLREGALRSGPLADDCTATRLSDVGTARVWHLALSHSSGGGVELWVFGEGEGLRVHARPTPR